MPKNKSASQGSHAQTKRGLTGSTLQLLARIARHIFKLIGQILNAVGIVLLALLEASIKLLQAVWGTGFKILVSFIELLSALLVEIGKPFRGLLGNKASQQGTNTQNALTWLGFAMIAYYLSTIIPVLLPIQLKENGWYAAMMQVLVGNGALLLFGLFSLCLAQTWPGTSGTLDPLRGKQTSITRIFAALFFLIIPGFIFTSHVAFKQLDTNTSNQLSSIREQREQALGQIASATDQAPLRRLIQASRSEQPAAGETLEKVKSSASDVVLKASIIAEDQLNTQVKNTQFKLTVKLFQMSLSSFALAVGSIALANWSAKSKKSLGLNSNEISTEDFES